MDDTTRLALPLVAPAQAQKHVTVNEAFTRLDGLVQGAVLGTGSAPPGSPGEGECWIVGEAPTGAWQGWAGDIAMFAAGGWLRLAAREGWRVWDMDAQTMRLRAAAGWVPMADVLGDLGALGLGTGAVTGLGINAAVDATNRFVFDGSNMLFTSGASIDATLNKAAPGDEASLSFKTGYSVRAMAGLLGDDDFTLKVSADGGSFLPALVVRHDTGAVEMPGGARIAGHAALHRGNLLGTVAQSGGVPAGAVIERGGNANGEYVRWADGTQICRHNANVGSGMAFGSGTWADPYRSEPFIWTFPAAFSAAPTLSVTPARWTSGARDKIYATGLERTTATEALDVSAVRIGSTTNAGGVILHLTATGRWH